MKPTIIIGAGVTGCSAAYHLARLGQSRVIVLEQTEIGAGSSSRAAGITTGLLWTDTGIRARQHALRRFREMSRELEGYQFHNEHGCLNLVPPETWPQRAELLRIYDRLHVPYQILNPTEVRRRWPAISADPTWIALHDPLGGYSEPTEYLPALADAAEQRGVEIHPGTQVSEICISESRVVGVKTRDRLIETDTIIVATYAWCLPLLARAGIRLPIKTFVHQRYVSTPLAQSLVLPPINADPLSGYIRPAAGNRLLLGIETPHRGDFKVDSLSFRMDRLAAPPGLLENTVDRFAALLPLIKDVGWESSHVGLLSFSQDGEPLLGPVPGISGLYIGNCFHSGGFSYSPAVGLFLAEWIVQGRPSIDLSAFSPGRFGRDETEAYLASTITQASAFRRRH